MFYKSKITVMILVMGALLMVMAPGQARQEEATPLLIGFYGEAGTPAALGMQVAVSEINSVGAFAGADGRSYRFIGVVTDDLSLLTQSLVLFMTPASPAFGTPVSLSMPVMMLSPNAELTLENLDGVVYRAMSAEQTQLAALADFLLRFGAGQNIVLMGDTELYGSQFLAFAEAISVDPAVTLQTVATSLPTPEEINQLATLNPQVVLYYGSPAEAGVVLAALEASTWRGLFIYPHAYEAAQAGVLQSNGSVQVLGMTSWSNAAKDPLSQAFRQTYVTQTGKLPTAEAVSAYDVTWAIRLLVQRLGADPSLLAASLPGIELINTTQGQVNPAAYGGFELFQSAQIYALQTLGGMDVLARYDGGQYLGEAQDIANLPTPTPQPSATPSQPVVIVQSNTLNVRTGPGENYPRIGSLQEGDQVTVMGATADFTWFFVQSPSGLGWVKGEFVELYNPLGGVTGIAAVQIPPTPTPGATAVPLTPPDIFIESVALNPSRVVIGQSFSASVTLRNNGETPALNFAVNATWMPGNVPTSVQVPSLDPFGTVTVVLQATLTSAGAATVTVTADQANQVLESNETNNSFNVSYVVDAVPTVEASNSYGVNALNFAGEFADIDWTGTQLNTLNGATVGIITGTPFENVNVSMLTAPLMTNNTVGTLQPGTIFGLRTGQGHCGVFRIEGVTGANITFTFRMYAVTDCD